MRVLKKCGFTLCQSAINQEPELVGESHILLRLGKVTSDAVTRLKSFEEVRCMRWRCVKCGFIVHYTRPMPEHVVDPCPKCHGPKFVPAP